MRVPGSGCGQTKRPAHPWLAGPAGASPFVANWETGLLDQFAAGLPTPVDELHALAPFFDREARALAAALAATRPRRLHLYLGRDASVDGGHLAAVLAAARCAVQLHGFDPDTFVHAKLLGAVTGARGRLLSGSANLSQVALLGTVAGGTGNVEAGVLLDLDAARVRAAFAPPGLARRDRPGAALAALTFRPADEPPTPRLLLRSAARLGDGRVAVSLAGDADAVGLALTDGRESCPLRDGRTREPLLPEREPVLVWLVDAAGDAASNKVPVDDPERLAGWLRERAASSDHPRGLEAEDLPTPVGRMLQRLHRESIFDLDEGTGAARGQDGGAEDGTEDADFWDRLQREELRLAPRAERYGWLRGTGLVEEDDIFALSRRSTLPGASGRPGCLRSSACTPVSSSVLMVRSPRAASAGASR